MKLTNFTAGVLALAGVALLSPTAQASLTANPSDLFLGFRLVGDTEGYLIDIGNYTQFTTTANFTLSLGNIGADLVNLFGADWNTNANLYWGIVGTTYVDDSTPAVLYATRERSNVAVPATLWKGKSNSTQTTTAGKFQELRSGYLDLGVTSQLSTNSSVAVIQDVSRAKSYATYTSPSLDFGTWTTVEGSFKNGTAGSVLDLQQINPVTNQNAVFLGSFQLDDDGNLTYLGAQAVPEPSTYVMTIGGIALLTVLRRRKSLAAA